MKNLKRVLTLVLVTIMTMAIIVPVSAAADSTVAKRQAALSQAATILRDQLGLPDDHAAVRALSETWWYLNGEGRLARTYYFSGRTNGYYYVGETNSSSPDTTAVTTNYNSNNRRQKAAKEAVDIVSAVFNSRHPAMAAVNDVLSSECGVMCTYSFLFSAGDSRYYYFNGSYAMGNNGGTFDQGYENNLGKIPGNSTGNNGSTESNGNNSGNSGNSGNSNTGNTTGNTAGTGNNYALYSAQNYYSGIFTGTDSYVNASDALIVAKMISSHCYNETSITRQAAMGWTVINLTTTLSFEQAAAKFPDYNAGAPTVDAYGRDLLLLAKDLLFRHNAEMSGVADVGRVLPADYGRIWVQGNNLFFRNQPGENAPNWGFTMKSPYNS